MFKHVKKMDQVEEKAKFQSLGRDSGCSSTEDMVEKFEAWAVSIPRSGFWVFKLQG